MLRVEPEIQANYVADGRVQMAFHHVLDLGPGSLLGSSAVECAAQQNPATYWQLRNLLFERQSDLFRADAATVVTWAGELGLDTAAMQSCMSDPAVAGKVQEMDAQRRAAGVRLRPTFEINGQRVEGAAPYAALAATLDEALAQP